jgi:hypothetical protein
LPLLAGFVAGAVPGFEGGWSDAPFAAAVPENILLDFALSAGEFDLGAPILATDAKLEVGLAAGTLHVDLAEASLAGGTFKGSVVAAMRDGEAQVSLSGGLAGGQLQALVWERTGLPVASGMLDVSFDAAGRGRSMAALVAGLTGSGAFAVSDGRLNALNAEALAAVMQAAEGDTEPDEEMARETFASLFGSGALPFGRAAGSFSVEAGMMAIPTVALAVDKTTVLAGATLDLNRLTLASDWTVRLEESGTEEAQPFVEILFSGPIADPERRIDLNPLLDLLRSRFQQRQLDHLEALEQERRRAEAETPPVADEPVTDEALVDVPSPPPESEPVEAEPEPTPARIEPPIELVPAPQPQAVRPRATPPAPPPAPTPPPAQPSFEEEYRTLPNGVVIKIR